MIDESVVSPGPQGWGEEFTTADSRFGVEARTLEHLYSNDPELMRTRAARQPNQEMIDRVKRAMLADGIEDGFSCRHVEKVVFGDFLRWLRQIIGSCVASGGMRAMARRSLIESFLLGDPEEIWGTKLVGTNNVAPFGPYSYRAGRKYAGINSGDGSYCSAHIKGAKDYGILPCSAQGLVSDAFPEPQSSRLYRDWGNSNSLLEQYAEGGRAYKLLESVKVSSLEQAKELLTVHFKPFMVCSMWAFRPDYTHASWKLEDGSPVVIYKRDHQTSWAHNMTIDGMVQVNGQGFVIVDNSWGETAHKNGSWFAIPIDLYGSWIRDSEQMSIGEIDLTDNSTI